MVHRPFAVLVVVALLGLSCGCANIRDWRLFSRRSTEGCPCADFADPYCDGPMLESAGAIVVQPGDAMATAPNGGCATSQPSVVPPPRLIAQPQSAQPTSGTPSKNSR